MTEPLKAVDSVEADARSTDGSVVELVTESATVQVTVPRAGRWKSRAMSLLRQADYEGWAQTTLSPEDYQAWQDADPTNDEVNTFFTAWAAESGESQGKSSASQRSSRSTARR